MSNPFIHIELNTGNPKAAKAFYKKLFDWKMTDTNLPPAMAYTMIHTSAGKNGAGGGIWTNPMPGAPPAWMPYVEVADVKKSVAKAAKLGAKVHVAFQEIPGGTLGVFEDPTGAVIGVWAKAKKAAKKAGKKDAARKAAKKPVKKNAKKK
ncbi:MAG: VOC family protein [Deltaproteobacteria bacterium]